MIHFFLYWIALILGYRGFSRYSRKITISLSKNDKEKLSSYMLTNSKRIMKNRIVYLIFLILLIALLQHRQLPLLNHSSAFTLRILWVAYTFITVISLSLIQLDYAQRMRSANLPAQYITQSHQLCLMACAYITLIITVFFGYLTG